MGNMDFDENVDAVASATVQATSNGYEGNAKLLADMFAYTTGGDIHFIEQIEKYPSAYRGTTDKARSEQSSNTRPELATTDLYIDSYDTIILIYPNWWGTLPQGVFTFLESYDFSGKTIVPVATHEGSGLGRGPTDIRTLCPDADVTDGLSIRGGSTLNAQGDIDRFLTDLGM